MHIVLGLLGTIVTILILLNRLADAGIDLGGLNPFLWHRRRMWKQKYQGNPIFQLDSPMEATALLMAAVAKAEGDMSAEQKLAMLAMFQDEFGLSRKDASSLLIATTHILQDGEEVRANVAKVLAPNVSEFTAEQAESCVALINRVANIDEVINAVQQRVIDDTKSFFSQTFDTAPKWR
ncbi:MAG: hypothetical protein K0U93_20145 [Gammaproteobacteria bacterium]|nr:hypothetical protein [Gammaproteobacteria bacterium]